MNKLIYKLFKKLSIYLLRYVFNYIDKDDNGEISEKEIKEFLKELGALTALAKK